ncbi:MAG: thioredoxin domain-containing protein [Terriglobales bacterium]
MASSRWIAIVGVLLFSSLITYGETGLDCAPLDTAVRARVLQVAARSMGSDPVLPVIDSEELLAGTCYWQFFVTLPHKKGHSVLYLSPDHHFVSPALWDLNSDFQKEDAKADTQLRSEAEADHPPIRGPETAPVTVVLFSDFQCPYCAAFAQMVGQYQKDNPGKMRLIFRNNPLPMHKWAKVAARTGICVARQSPDAFWKFQDFLFSKQKETTAENLGERVNDFLQTAPEVRSDKYLECMATPYPETRLDRDLEEASAYRIHSTPTLFINGRRHGGFASAEDFAAVVAANIHTKTAKQEGERK